MPGRRAVGTFYEDLGRRVNRKMNILKIEVNTRRYPIEAVRYVAYTFSDRAFVFIRKIVKDRAEVSLEANSPKSDVKKTKKSFAEGLEEEMLRRKIHESNKGLREFLIMKAMSPEKEAAPEENFSGLTPEQELELEKLISEVEKEIKQGAQKSKRGGDPLEIRKTWEEKYDKK